MKALSEIISHISTGEVSGDLNVVIENIEYDSRLVTKNSLFCALKGLHTDGHEFILQAIERGASAILFSNDINDILSQIPKKSLALIRVKEYYIKKILAKISMILYDFPARELKVIGVTGTDGKSTTCSIIQQLLSLYGYKSGMLSTVEFIIGDTTMPNIHRQSTPESPQIHKALREMCEAGCEYAILEATSHGLSEETCRLWGIEYDVGILTNIEQEHLEFHKTLKNYVYSKSLLFQNIKPAGVGILRKEERYTKEFQRQLFTRGTRDITFSLDNPAANLYIKELKSDLFKIEGIICKNKTRVSNYFESPFILYCAGKYNAENLLASLLALDNFGIPMKDLVEFVPRLKLPKGRLELVRKDLNIIPIVDYAHTPGSFTKLIPEIKKYSKGKLIMTFGSAGERDVEKRKKQGKIADEFADIIILTNEDPRLEDPTKILQQIASGCTHHTINKNLFLIPDRRMAIHKALSLADAHDTLLFLGKGHEKSIQHADFVEHWDEHEVVNAEINKLLPMKNW